MDVATLLPDAFCVFTQRAQRVATLAGQHAQLGNDKTIEPKHFLSAIAWEGLGGASRVLRDFAVDRSAFCIQRSEHSHRSPVRPAPPLGTASVRLIRVAVTEAMATGDLFVGVEHLLLALLRLADDGVFQFPILAADSRADLYRQLISLVGIEERDETSG